MNHLKYQWLKNIQRYKEKNLYKSLNILEMKDIFMQIKPQMKPETTQFYKRYIVFTAILR